MKQVSFDDIHSVAATFAAQEGVVSGQVVKITANGQVGPCSDNDAFCGVALSGAPFVGVQVKGFVTVKATGSIALGYTKVCANGQGGVKAGGSREYLVVETDSTAGTAVLYL